jgi:hypothetical protein
MEAKPTEVTQEIIDGWKAKHGDVYKITVLGETVEDKQEPDKVAYLKKPNRQVLSYASKAGAQDPFKFNETIFKMCFLGGDENIIENDEDFFSVSAQISEIVKFKQATLEKL